MMKKWNKNNTRVYTFDCFTKEQIKEINKGIKKNIFGKESSLTAAKHASKKGNFFHVSCSPLMGLLYPWLHECQLINKTVFGYDTYWDFHIDTLNYNTYEKNGEYGWHIDANESCEYDLKLTCLLNLSEEPYEGGDFYTINQKEKHEFTSGMGLVFNSMVAHKITPVTKGERITLTYWALGSSWK